MTERPDKDLAFMLQYENVAWYEDGAVRILDRRCYPRTVSFVTCSHYGEVLQAMGVKTVRDGVKGYYPAFDVTPPELVTGVVTDRGIFRPYALKAYGAGDAYEVVV